ncbi:MAG: hypothetical protein PHP37_01140 [Patescibacteria group bacterium]|nr:hypothetical protein [Patescibacteria group bacterium]
MKKAIAICFFIFGAIFFAQAQVDSSVAQTASGFQLKNIDFSSGRSALGSGIYIIFNSSSQKYGASQITFAQDKILINHFFSIGGKKKIHLGPSAGYFKNVPYAGAIMTTSPFKGFSTLHWAGCSFGQPEGSWDVEPSFLFLVNVVNYDIWRFRVSHTVISFQKDAPKHVSCLRYTQKVSSDFSAYTDIAYDITNKTQLLRLGVNWKIN